MNLLFQCLCAQHLLRSITLKNGQIWDSVLMMEVLHPPPPLLSIGLNSNWLLLFSVTSLFQSTMSRFQTQFFLHLPGDILLYHLYLLIFWIHLLFSHPLPPPKAKTNRQRMRGRPYHYTPMSMRYHLLVLFDLWPAIPHLLWSDLRDKKDDDKCPH